MEQAGALSWRFAESSGQMSHVALFVRDAVRLEVPDNPVVPPALAAEVPDRCSVLDDEQRRAAGRQWTSWWRAVVSDEVRRNAGPGRADPDEWPRAAPLSAGSWPDFDVLGDRPELRQAVRALFEEGARWADDGPRRRPPAPGASRFPWPLVRDVAEDVAFDRHVGLDAVQGGVELLAVSGVWWTRAAPGAVLCSTGAAADPTTAHAVVREAFESGLRRER